MCITHYNCVATVEKSLKSILDQIDDRFEIVLVDNLSNDGSRSILEEFARQGAIRLFEKRCSRGMGRQKALKEAVGDYVISGLDMDEVFKPNLLSLLDFYHKKCEGSLLRGRPQSPIFAPRKVLSELGGWRNLQYSENWELTKRSAKAGVYVWTIFPITEGASNPHPERQTFLGSIRYRYIRYRDNLRVGHRLFEPNQSVGLKQRLTQLAAIASFPFYGSYRGGTAGFTSIEPEYFVDSREWWFDGTDAEREHELYRRLLRREFP